jgi:integrase
MNPLHRAVNEYLELRRGLGFKLVNHEPCLREFVSFLARKKTSLITTALAVQFATLHPQQQPKAQAARYSTVRGFARYRSGAEPATEIPPCDVSRLLAAAHRLAPTYGLRPWTYYCFFGLLAVTGLRLSEALNLQCQDIDWAEGLLTIRKTKFGKSRLIPLHASSVKVLAAYAKRRARFLAQGRDGSLPQFFVTKFGTPLREGSVYRVFWALSKRIGLRDGTASHQPRLHDLRHRFAIKTLLRWYRAGEKVDRRLPELSTYLGHVQVADTYWYLSCTPELMAAAGNRMERRWEGVL